jgi:single-strand DNA-binding protein
MSKSVNKVFLVGNLAREPELRYTENKKPVCTFGLATNLSWQPFDATEKHEETEYHRIIAWDKLAETCHQYLRKGRKVHIRDDCTPESIRIRTMSSERSQRLSLRNWSC